MTWRTRCIELTIALSVAALACRPAAAVGTAFTYQGQLQENSSPTAQTSCDFQFKLFDAAGTGSPPTGGTQIGSTLSGGLLNAVAVSNGVFTVALDFGASAFDGNDRYLDVAVCCPAGSCSASNPPYGPAFAPRQKLTATPYALAAGDLTCTGCVGGSDLGTGVVDTAQLHANAVTSAQIKDGEVMTSDLAKIGRAHV